MDKIRIVIADHSPMDRDSIAALLKKEKNMEVVGSTTDGEETVLLAEKLKPDVIIMELMLSKINGLEASREIRSRFPGIKIIILTMHSSNMYVIEAFRIGVSGYLLKNDSKEGLMAAIEAVNAGKRYLSGLISGSISEFLGEKRVG